MVSSASAQLHQPPVIPGMEKINRYWDKSQKAWAAKIAPGELYVSAQGELIVTVLGSCVSACIRDKFNGIGGMNHFMLPKKTDHPSKRFSELKTRYGTWAMEVLINEIIKNGGRREHLEVKVFGGGAVLESMTNDIGDKNINFAFDYLQREHLTVVASSVGGMSPRKVYYNPITGRCRVKLIDSSNRTLLQREAAYAKRVAKDTDGSIELF